VEGTDWALEDRAVIGSSAAALDQLDGDGVFSMERNLELWAQVPEELRLECYTPEALPAHPAFGWRLEYPYHREVDVRQLPEPMRRELCFAFWRIIEQGLRITDFYAHMARSLELILIERRAAGRPLPRSLMDQSLHDWEREWRLVRARRGPVIARVEGRAARTRRTGKLALATNPASSLRRCYRHLVIAYDPRDWWEHDLWAPKFDPRIPLRPHEPSRANSGYDFLAISQPWLREALKWHSKVCLETGALRWTTIRSRLHALKCFSEFLERRGVDEPRLAPDAAGVRLLALDFLAELRQRKAERGRNKGQPLANGTITTLLCDIEQFYAFIADHRHEAAKRLAEPGWLLLDDGHARLWRAGEKPLKPSNRVAADASYFDDVTMGQVLQHAGVLAAPKGEGGMGDEQAMRLLMLLVRTGRRVSELCLLDFDCLLPLQGLPERADSDALVAKLRYQQTKIEGAPDTIVVDQEVVEIIRAQQAWAHAWTRKTLHDPNAPAPRYLFLSTARNHKAEHPYPKTTLGGRLQALAERMDIRDAQGQRVRVSRVHRFRHTKATSLLNAGVPVHVVQRYLGHISPRMTMHYAQTVRETHEREFLRYRKITADARELEVDPRDLYDALELDKRTDRVLPNGLCMLPPRQACERGNACLTCDKFATDRSYLAEHQEQLTKLTALIEQRKQAFHAKTGQQMSDDNVWLSQRLTERRALVKIVDALQDPALDAADQAVRGAGVSARPAFQDPEET
jgi:Phage integrase family